MGAWAAGRLLIIAGAVFLLVGVVFLLQGRGVVPSFPGNVSLGQNARFWIPLGTCLVLSVLLSLALNVVLRR